MDRILPGSIVPGLYVTLCLELSRVTIGGSSMEQKVSTSRHLDTYDSSGILNRMVEE